MTLGELIVKYRTEHGLSQRQFANACDLSNGYISMLEKNLNPKTQQPLVPSIAVLQKISVAMSITLNELFQQVDDMPISMVDVPVANNILPIPATREIPLLGEIACGEPILAEENIEEIIKIPDSIHADFALQCKGDSMIGARILDGDIVYIRQQPDVDDGDIAAVLIGNEATLKRVYKMPGRLQLRAENPAFPSINLEGDELETVRILGKAVAFTSPVK